MLYYEYAPDPFDCPDLQAVCPAARCALCGDELYFGQCCYLLEGVPVCEACLPAYARALFHDARVRICRECPA